jgi:hypothetical protein
VYWAKFGPLTLWLKQIRDEIHIAERWDATERDHECHGLVEYTGAGSEALSWSRWIVTKETEGTAFRVLPCLPDRPVVVRTASPVKLPVGREAVFFVSIPIWLRLQMEGAQTIELEEVPTVVRSNIWFGDPTSGELCYSLMSRAQREVMETEQLAYKAVCPVKIRNVSDERLDMERFCVHVEYLSLYEGTHFLWCNEVTITFQGKDLISKISYARKKPKLGENLTSITGPRTIYKETLLKRSLNSFARLTDF